jgi:hypothetical protein
LHWQLLALLAALAGSVTEPQPQWVHGALLPPGAKKPSAQGAQAAARKASWEAWAAESTPCPGTQLQSARAVAPGAEVFLLAGQAAHGLLLRAGA